LGGALRLVRLGMVILAIGLGLYGLMLGTILLLWHLASIQSFGLPYTSPLSSGGLRRFLSVLFRPPLWMSTLWQGLGGGGFNRGEAKAVKSPAPHKAQPSAAPSPRQRAHSPASKPPHRVMITQALKSCRGAREPKASRAMAGGKSKSAGGPGIKSAPQAPSAAAAARRLPA